MAAWTGRARRWAPHALTVVAVLAAVLLSVGGIASQLAGRTVLADTDAMVTRGEFNNAGFAGTTSKNVEFADVYTAELPSTIVFKKALEQGDVAQWNPYVVGGTPLGGIPNNALLSPVSLPNYVLPSWLGPAYERLAELVVGIAGSFLLLRRLGLRRPAAVTGGTVYVAAGFMVTWMGWPQTRVAAFIPLLFWAAEKLIQERRFRDSAVLALVTCGFLLGGFPAVEGFALLTLACYSLVRLLAQRRDGGFRRVLGTGVGLGVGVGAGLGLALFQLLPFAKFYSSWVIEGRDQEVSYHLSPTALVTSFAPWALGGTDTKASPRFFLGMNPVEAMSYIGAAAVVLAVIGAACWQRGRALLPPGAWLFFVVSAILWLELVYWGGLPLKVLQSTPVLRALFGSNFIGRARSMTGFLVAMLAAIGLELILRRRDELRVTAGTSAFARWFPRVWAGVVVAVVVVGSAVIVVQGHTLAVKVGSSESFDGATNAVPGYDHAVLVGLAVAVVAALCAGLVWTVSWRGTRETGWLLARGGAASVVLFLIAGQGASWIDRYSPSAPKSTFYPVTDTQQFLTANLGHQRIASTSAASPLGTVSAYQIRTLNGHSFLSAPLAAMVRAIPGNPTPTPTQLTFADDGGQATSPVLDRLGVAYFQASPQEPVFGRAVAPKTDGGSVTLRSGVPVTAPLPQGGPVRAVRILPGEVPSALVVSDPQSWVEVKVQDAAGATVATAKRLTLGMTRGEPFDIPVTADTVPAGTALTATVTLHTPVPLAVAAEGGAVALGEVTGQDDGLRLVFAGSSVIYQRLNALSRIRWATATQVVPDEATRVRLLADGSVKPSTVLLNTPGPAASGAPADVDVTQDGNDSISATVDASGAGYLVVADALQTGWAATVDGKAAALVPADQGVVAVAVPGGRHTVTLSYRSPDHGLGAWVGGATACVLLLGTGTEWWLRRRGQALPGPLGAAWPGRPLPAASSTDDEASPDVREPALREPEGSGPPSRR